jgi:hypothetical protein
MTFAKMLVKYKVSLFTKILFYIVSGFPITGSLIIFTNLP